MSPFQWEGDVHSRACKLTIIYGYVIMYSTDMEELVCGSQVFCTHPLSPADVWFTLQCNHPLACDPHIRCIRGVYHQKLCEPYWSSDNRSRLAKYFLDITSYSLL